MSRQAAPKSRGDKSRPMPVVPVQQVVVDVIPGRFTEEDWLSMVATEDGEDVVGEIVDGLMSRVMDECYAVYLRHQVMPFTISQAREVMIQMVNWTFVPRDKNEDELEANTNWQEEPNLCPFDSWAQGCVPITQSSYTPRSTRSQVWPEHRITETTALEVSPQTLEITKSPNNVEDPPLTNHGPERVEVKSQTPELLKSLNTVDPPQPDPGQQGETNDWSSASQKIQPLIKPTPPPVPKKTQSRYRPHRGPLRSAGLRDITKSLEETEKEMMLDQFLKEKEEKKADESFNLLPPALHNILKIQLMRPPQKKDVIYDNAGNILSVPKVDISKLPQYCVLPHVQVLDTNEKAEVISRKAIYVGGRSPGAPPKRPLRAKTIISAEKFDDSQNLRLDNSHHLFALNRAGRMESVHSPDLVSAGVLLETLQLSHGVILRESDRTARGSIHRLMQNEQGCKEDRRVLRPIPASITLPSISVEELIKNNVPQVQPLMSFISS